MLKNKNLTNIATLTYESFDGQINTIYSNEINTNLLKCQPNSNFCIYSCINLYAICSKPVIILDIGTYASLIDYQVKINGSKHTFIVKLCLLQNIYYKNISSSHIKCYEYRKYINHSFEIYNDFHILSNVYSCSKCIDYCVNNSNKLLTSIVVNLCIN